jgi:hypothetical protein
LVGDEVPGPLSIAEIVLLEETTFDLDNRGEIRRTPKFIKLPDNLRYTVKLYNRLLHGELELPVGKTEWEVFQKTVAVRNRIMHPKRLSDFDVTEAEAEQARGVSHWFNHMLIEAVRLVHKRGTEPGVATLRDA